MLYPEIKKITKTKINELPVIEYTGIIEFCNTFKKAEQSANELLQEKIIGFDTETRPTFRKGEYYLPSILQLATKDKVYLFQLKKCSLSSTLIKVLNNKKIIKTGVAIKRDIQELKKIRLFEANGFIELADIAKQAGVENLGLRSLTALFLEHRISKKEQISNWAKNTLTDSQKRYAATDAWLGRELYILFKQEGFFSPAID